MRFNPEVVLIPNLQDGVAQTAFRNGLLLGRFNFSLIQSKVITLAKALSGAQDFMHATKICTRDKFIWQDAQKRGGEENSTS